MRGPLTVCVVLALLLAPGATLAAEEEPSATGSFSPAGSLAEARTAHTATLLSNDRILVIGGGGFDDRVLASAEVWEPRGG